MAEITSSNPIAEAKAKSIAADGVKHKRGWKPLAKSKLLDELKNCGAEAKQFSNILTQHKIEHSIPQGKALGCCLTEHGKLKIMVKKLNESDVQLLLEKIVSLDKYYFVGLD